MQSLVDLDLDEPHRDFGFPSADNGVEVAEGGIVCHVLGLGAAGHKDEQQKGDAHDCNLKGISKHPH
jgi:hypothetical protein